MATIGNSEEMKVGGRFILGKEGRLVLCMFVLEERYSGYYREFRRNESRRWEVYTRGKREG